MTPPDHSDKPEPWETAAEDDRLIDGAALALAWMLGGLAFAAVVLVLSVVVNLAGMV